MKKRRKKMKIRKYWNIKKTNWKKTKKLRINFTFKNHTKIQKPSSTIFSFYKCDFFEKKKLTQNFVAGANFRLWEAFIAYRNIASRNYIHWIYDGDIGWNTAKWTKSSDRTCLSTINIASSSSYSNSARLHSTI